MLTQLWAQLTNVWERMTRIQRSVLGVVLLLGIALVGTFTWWASVPEYAVAFSGLSEADAGMIVEKLKAQNIPYQLEAGGAILVPKNQVYDVRLSMAKDGLPNGSTVGYELFNANSLGLTEFSQKVNYQRALEGELARTIESLGAVKAVRVHIVMPEQALFVDQQKPTTASITLQLKPGQRLDRAQVQAITHLVASSIEGLKPEDVVVVDTEGKMLSAANQGEEVTGLTDDQQMFQRSYEAEIEAKVQDMLVQAFGPNKSIVRVNADLNWDRVETTSQTFGPTPVVRSSSVISEVYSGTGGVPGGIPGASSNLPSESGTAPTYQTTGTQTANSAYQRNETTTNYEVTAVQTHTVVTPGQVKKLSVSVLIDNVSDPATLDVLNSIVSLAAGIDEERGDQVTVQSMAFDRSYFETEAAGMEREAQIDLYVRIAIWVAIGLAAFILVWFVYRLLNNLRLTAAQDVWTPLIGAPAEPLALAAAPAASRAALGGSASGAVRPGRNAALTSSASSESGSLTSSLSQPAEGATPTYQLPQSQIPPELEHVQRTLSRLAEQRPATAAEIVRLWLEEDAPRK